MLSCWNHTKSEGVHWALSEHIVWVWIASSPPSPTWCFAGHAPWVCPSRRGRGRGSAVRGPAPASLCRSKGPPPVTQPDDEALDSLGAPGRRRPHVVAVVVAARWAARCFHSHPGGMVRRLDTQPIEKARPENERCRTPLSPAGKQEGVISECRVERQTRPCLRNFDCGSKSGHWRTTFT